MGQKNTKKSTEKEVLLSRGKTATAESCIAGFEAHNALDQLDDTYWAASSHYAWWKIDLEQSCLVTRLKINNGAIPECSYRCFIEYSTDNLNWAPAVEKRDNSKTVAEGDQYEVNLTARYLRVTVTYCSIGETVRIQDFKVYGHQLKEAEEAVIHRKAPAKFYAASCDEASGFVETEATDIEPECTVSAMIGDSRGQYLFFKNIDLSDIGVDQMRGYFGFTDKDKTKRITLEVRLDSLQGEKIGELVLFRQYTPWSQLAGKLERDDKTPLAGVHDVYLVITNVEAPQQLMIHWLAFVKKSPLPAPKPLTAPLPPPENGEYKIYFGNLHSHTCLSDGTGTPEEAYDYARYTANLDFLAITEHSNLYDHFFDWDKSRKWADIKRIAHEKTEEGAFLALIGSETTWYNQFGHMNTYNVEFFLNAYELEYNHIPNYYDTLKQYPDGINQWNHPWSCGNRRLDGFDPYDAELDKVLYLLEIESEQLGGLSYYISALDKGWHVAPLGSQDNHHKQWGTESNLRTAILVDKLTTAHFFDAVRHYRVYFTTAIHMKVWFKINDAIMGSTIKRTERLHFHIEASNLPTDSPIVKAEVIGEQGRVKHTILDFGHRMECDFSIPCEDRYYFMKIYQQDGEYAATAPIWIENE